MFQTAQDITVYGLSRMINSIPFHFQKGPHLDNELQNHPTFRYYSVVFFFISAVALGGFVLGSYREWNAKSTWYAFFC